MAYRVKIVVPQTSQNLMVRTKMIKLPVPLHSSNPLFSLMKSQPKKGLPRGALIDATENDPEHAEKLVTSQSKLHLSMKIVDSHSSSSSHGAKEY
jgi:hypothetical protein